MLLFNAVKRGSCFNLIMLRANILLEASEKQEGWGYCYMLSSQASLLADLLFILLWGGGLHC